MTAQGKIIELERELETQIIKRKLYMGDSIKELVGMYEKENEILKKMLDVYRVELKVEIEELKELNAKITKK
jgi:hypothetical protein